MFINILLSSNVRSTGIKVGLNCDLWEYNSHVLGSVSRAVEQILLLTLVLKSWDSGNIAHTERLALKTQHYIKMLSENITRQDCEYSWCILCPLGWAQVSVSLLSRVLMRQKFSMFPSLPLKITRSGLENTFLKTSDSL